MSDTPGLSDCLTESLTIYDPATASTTDSDTNTAPRAPPPPPTPALARLRALLRQTLRITITDGRIFLGTFAGTDRLLNVLLINTDEFRLPPAPNPNPHGRFVGLVLVPWRLVVRIEVHAPPGRERAVEGEIVEDGEDGEAYAYRRTAYRYADDGLYS